MTSNLLTALCCAGLLVTMAGCSRGEKAAPANQMPQAVEGEEVVRDEENAHAEPSQPANPDEPEEMENPEIPAGEPKAPGY